MNFFKNFRNNVYGIDELNYFLAVMWLIFCLIGNITEFSVFITIGTVIVIYALFRAVSFNKAKRYIENQKFLTYKKKFDQAKARLKDKNHNYYKCPQCSQYLSVPKGVGKVCIVCSKCKHQFIRKSK